MVDLLQFSVVLRSSDIYKFFVHKYEFHNILSAFLCPELY